MHKQHKTAPKPQPVQPDPNLARSPDRSKAGLLGAAYARSHKLSLRREANISRNPDSTRPPAKAPGARAACLSYLAYELSCIRGGVDCCRIATVLSILVLEAMNSPLSVAFVLQMQEFRRLRSHLPLSSFSSPLESSNDRHQPYVHHALRVRHAILDIGKAITMAMFKRKMNATRLKAEIPSIIQESGVGSRDVTHSALTLTAPARTYCRSSFVILVVLSSRIRIYQYHSLYRHANAMLLNFRDTSARCHRQPDSQRTSSPPIF